MFPEINELFGSEGGLPITPAREKRQRRGRCNDAH